VIQVEVVLPVKQGLKPSFFFYFFFIFNPVEVVLPVKQGLKLYGILKQKK